MEVQFRGLNPILWKGFGLIAEDGTSISLPASPKIKTHFKIHEVTKGSTHTELANCAILYTVLSNLVIDASIDLMAKEETKMMNQLLDKASFSNTILLLERGFG